MPDACPCGSRLPYPACCGRLHRGEAVAATPEELMRSRYSAFVVGDADYLLRTWHPRTRPTKLRLDPAVVWLSLQIVDATGDEVEFVARYRGPGGRSFQRERSRFVARGESWFYLDGTGLLTEPAVRPGTAAHRLRSTRASSHTGRSDG